MRVVPITEDHADDVIEMLKKSFFTLETLNASIGLADPDGGCPELERYCRTCISSAALNLMARDEASGQIVGVILNSLLRRPADAGGTRNPNCRLGPDSTKFDKVLAINHAAERAGDLFLVYPGADRALDVKILATDPSHVKKGIATALLRHAVGAFSAAAAGRVGFTLLGEARYAEFLDADGVAVFNPPPPHRGVSVWALPLDSSACS